MTLRELLGEGGDVEIAHLADDSREVVAGTLFFCIRGFEQDGHDFALDAVRRGAAAVVVERPLALGVPEVQVPCVRFAIPPIAARFFGRPSEELQVIVVTGTNGKTTTAYLLRAVFEAAGRTCGLLGTVETVIGGRTGESALTTPGAIDLQRGLRAMVDAGDRACAMEVSSHGLALSRVDAVRFSAAIFTNLTPDHLDFHKSMEAYFEVKRRLFVDRPALTVVNVDDEHGRTLALEDGAVTFALERAADYRASNVRTTLGGSTFTVTTPMGRHDLAVPLAGRHNVANALGALATAAELGVDVETAVGALERFGGVRGRFQIIDEGQPFAVVVDFAHTPDALEQLLRTASELARSRVICVFGCAGGRDTSTRAPMGEVAARIADQCVVTSDDPRSDDPLSIIAEVRQGMDGREMPIVDRSAAIRWAIERAGPGDVVVIAGRGHERIQRMNGNSYPLDDTVVARRALRRWRGTGVLH